ncbi:bifunctional hydroxymethylpyrimidine kinase/phosphomethylpyrimidine kinase [Sphaerobacter sp.]|uniref:bifunctional hydroxymethylpyrimidine kinase/phosphomethylpyrimidine kinase n=1 Tax=Sphaerobacter sp. TaxID=2099654 RepID=UPI0025E0E206|nr:bifunctional hydroxymethylpyrimidine kinase/phosphomethylpyrimidine kinase [Sphaerobacter sp.]
MATSPIAPPKALTIAGSDSGGGAGIQADLKTFAALNVYGSSVITAITAQNTIGVRAVHEIPPEIVAAQLDAVMEDIGADAAKTGMLASAEIIRAVVDGVRRHNIERLVVDPVMVAKSGDRLLREDAVAAIRDLLLPVAYVVTPNIPEAEVLTGREIRSLADMEEAARAIAALGARYVVVKGGHRSGDAIDIVYDGTTFQRIRSPRVETRNTHGTGCTFSAAIAARLAAGTSALEAIAEAKDYLYQALLHSYTVGAGHSPVHHFYALWRPLGVQGAEEVE